MQSRLVADDSRVGVFAVNDAANSELSACPTATVNYLFFSFGGRECRARPLSEWVSILRGLASMLLAQACI